MKPLVSISCVTFNHVDYIRDCFEGFLSQQTNFSFEILVHDDASTDGTKAIIEAYTEKYPTVFFPICQSENQYSKGVRGLSTKYNIPRVSGKYIAFSDGDDYWTDKQKLQKQFNFLEDNADFSICTAAYETNIISGGTTVIKLREDVPGKTYTFEKSAGFRPHYLNMFFVKKSLDVNKLKNFTYSGDNVIFIMCLSKGKGYFFNQVMGFRRNHIGGAWSSKNLLERLEMSSGQFISLYQYPEYKKVVRPILYYYYADLIASEKEQNRYIFSALKLVRTPKELMYFLKKIFHHKFRITTTFEEI